MTDPHDAHVALLRSRFAALLLEQGPASVLDVGCGGGAVLALLGAAVPRVVGVESESTSVAQLREAGFDAHVAPAEALPFASGSFDWVVMRHVPHHLVDERIALRDALRVARVGVLVAEPYFDPNLPQQRIAARIDDWSKELHRRQGRVHRPNLDAATLLSGLHDAEPDLVSEVHLWLPICARSLDDLDAEVDELLTAVGGPADRAEAARLRAIAARDGLGRNGSLAVLARRAPALQS